MFIYTFVVRAKEIQGFSLRKMSSHSDKWVQSANVHSINYRLKFGSNKWLEIIYINEVLSFYYIRSLRLLYPNVVHDDSIRLQRYPHLKSNLAADDHLVFSRWGNIPSSTDALYLL